MTSFISKNKNIEMAISLALLVFIALSSLADAAAPVLCIDQEKTHILAPGHHRQADCHPTEAVQAVNQCSPDIFLTFGGNHTTPCVDISFNTGDSSIPSHQTMKPLSARRLAFSLPTSVQSLHERSSRVAFPVHSQTYPAASSLASLQTTVLLI